MADQYVDPYAERLKLLRQQVEQGMAQPLPTQMYTPAEQALKAQELKRMQVLGQLGGISNDPAIMNISEPMLKRAMEAQKPKYAEHGAFDEASGKFSYFPGYQEARNLEQRQKMLQGTETASATAEARWNDNRQRAHEVSMLRHSLQANRPVPERGSVSFAFPDPDTGEAVYQHSMGGLVKRVANGFTPYNGKVGPKNPEMPSGVQNKYLENRAGYAMAGHAKEAVEANPEAVGMVGWLPEALRQYVPGEAGEGGVGPRALVGNVGSLKIHDRSGAAVTASESPRLRPFIPDVRWDSPATIKEKLVKFRVEYQSMINEIEKGYPLSTVIAQVNKQNAQGGIGGAPAQPQQQSADDALINKYLKPGR